jgi:capsular polysaccharide transport system permease protein
MRRDLGSRHGGDAVGNFWVFFEPLLITTVVLAVHWINGGAGTTGQLQGVSIVAIFITGFMPHLLLRHGGLAGVQSLKIGSTLLYHRQITYIDLMTARFLAETGFIIIVTAIVYAIFLALGFLALPAALGYFYLGWLFHIWFVVAVCLLFTGLGEIWEFSSKFFLPLAYAMIPVYAGFFMLSWLPPNIRNFLLWFPPADATEIVRRGYFGLAQPTYYNMPYTIGCLLVLTFIGTVVMKLGERRMEFA